MDRCPPYPDDDVAEHEGETCSRQSEPANPFLALADVSLAQLCAARADALESLCWATEAERSALRAGTVLLLDAVARRLVEKIDAPEAAAGVSVRFRLGDLIHESEHGPFLATYERRTRQRRKHGLFGT